MIMGPGINRFHSHVVVFPFPSLLNSNSHSRGNPIGIPFPWELPFPVTPLHRTKLSNRAIFNDLE